MGVIPVLDLMGGLVVQAVRGERENYRPVESVLVSGAEPLAVARALQEATNCKQFYIADLDAIMGRGNHLEILHELSGGLDAELWVDAAAGDVESVRALLQVGVGRVIVCSETLSDWNALSAIRSAFPAKQLLFSIDMKNSRVLSRSSSLRDRDPLDVLELLRQEGWSHFILLSLDQVGTGGGAHWELVESAHRRFPELTLIAGGGVRTVQDLERLTAHGASGVLVATSLHRGWITREELQALATRG